MRGGGFDVYSAAKSRHSSNSASFRFTWVERNWDAGISVSWISRRIGSSLRSLSPGWTFTIPAFPESIPATLASAAIPSFSSAWAFASRAVMSLPTPSVPIQPTTVVIPFRIRSPREASGVRVWKPPSPPPPMICSWLSINPGTAAMPSPLISLLVSESFSLFTTAVRPASFRTPAEIYFCLFTGN